jgi:hypothetical protein
MAAVAVLAHRRAVAISKMQAIRQRLQDALGITFTPRNQVKAPDAFHKSVQDLEQFADDLEVIASNVLNETFPAGDPADERNDSADSGAAEESDPGDQGSDSGDPEGAGEPAVEPEAVAEAKPKKARAPRKSKKAKAAESAESE